MTAFVSQAIWHHIGLANARVHREPVLEVGVSKTLRRDDEARAPRSRDYRSSRVLAFPLFSLQCLCLKSQQKCSRPWQTPPGKACHREQEIRSQIGMGSRQADVCEQAKKQGRHSRLPRRGLLLWGRGAAAGDALPRRSWSWKVTGEVFSSSGTAVAAPFRERGGPEVVLAFQEKVWLSMLQLCGIY